MDATLLVLLQCINGSTVDAFVSIRLQDPTRWPRHHNHAGTQQRSVPTGVGQSAIRTGREKRARLNVLHGTRGRRADDEVHESRVRGQEKSQDNPRRGTAGVDEVSASPAVSRGMAAGVAGEMGGFGWLREFGNGKMDITGLVLSTVLLMTAAAPLGQVPITLL